MCPIWMFAPAPMVMRPGFASVPVICPERIAMRISLADCEDHRPQRVFGEHVLAAAELAGWRRLAREGLFPWEGAEVVKDRAYV